MDARTTADTEAMRIGDRWPILGALMLAVMVIMLDNSVLNVALPAIGTALGASNAELQWVVTAYSVTFGGLLLTTGNLSDRMGRKKVLVVGLLLMAVGSALVVLAHTAAALIAIRALVGVGAALAMPSTLSLMYVTFPGPIRTKAVGIWSSVSLAGIVFGPLLAGFMLTRLSWQWLFAINIPVALVAVPVVLRAIPESKEATGEPTDFAGAVLSVGVLAALIYGLSSGPVEGWLSLPVLAAFGATVMLSVLFCWRELTATHPMLDLRTVASRAFAVPAVVEAAAFMAMASIMFIQTQLVQLVLGYSPLVAGLLSLPVVVALIVLTGPIATLANRLPVRVMIAGGLAISATGAGIIALWPTSVWAIIGGMVVVMIGVRASLTTVAIEVIDALPPGRAGIGSALNDTFQEVGGALGVGLLGALLNQAYRSALPAGAPAAVQSSIVGAVTDPTWIEPARAAFTHGASVALVCGMAILLVVGVAAAALHHPGLRTGLATGSPVPEDAEFGGPTGATLG